MNFFPRDQSGPVRNNLADRRPSLAEACSTGWSIEDEWYQFAGKAIHRAAILAPDADTKLHFGRIGIGRRGLTMTGIDAEKFRIDFIEAKAQPGEALAHDTVGCARFLERLRPAIDECADSFPSIAVADRELER